MAEKPFLNSSSPEKASAKTPPSEKASPEEKSLSKTSSSKKKRPEVPKEAKTLLRNLERRRGLLARTSGKEKEEIPEIVIKDTLLRFLDKQYQGLKRKYGKLEAKKIISGLNRRIFALINRAASLAEKKQDTAVVTSLYSRPSKGARKINESSYREFLREVKEIIKLCREYNVSIKSITGMQHGLGIPDTEKLEALLNWCQQKGVKFKSITGMQIGKGIPDLESLEALLKKRNKN